MILEKKLPQKLPRGKIGNFDSKYIPTAGLRKNFSQYWFSRKLAQIAGYSYHNIDPNVYDHRTKKAFRVCM
jgi:hypothetical protein